MKPNPQVVDVLVPRQSGIIGNLRARPRLSVGGAPPDFLGLIDPPHVELPLPSGREPEIAVAVAKLRSAGALMLRAPPGGGLTTFSNGVLKAAVEGVDSGYAISLRDIAWSAAPSAAEACRQHLDAFIRDSAQAGKGSADVLTQGRCVVRFDDLPDTHFLGSAERAGLFQSFRALAERPNVELLVTLPEMRAAGAIAQELGFQQHPVPALNGDDVWSIVQDIAKRFHVVIDPEALSLLAYAATTPAQLMSIIRSAAIQALEHGARHGVVDETLVRQGESTARFDRLELFSALDPMVLAGLLLERPYPGASPEEKETLARWQAYGLVTRLGRYGYALNMNIFSDALAAAISRDLWEGARAASEWNPMLGRRSLVHGIEAVIAARRGATH